VRAASSQSTPAPGRSALASGALTAIAALMLAASAAAAGAYLAHKFGRGVQTDGFLAAYGLYIVLTLGAQSFRLVVSPELTRAAQEEGLGGELRAYVFVFLAAGLPMTVLAVALAGPIGEVLTGKLPHAAAVEAGHALVWLIPAALAQLLAGLFAAGLAARDSYGVAALAYSVGGLVGPIVFVVFAGSHGLVALAWGVAGNAAVTLAIPLVVLWRRGQFRGGAAALRPLSRIWRLVEGSAVPIALQLFYVAALRLAAGLGIGRVTSFSYAYLLAATLVTATAFSLGIVSSAPLTRRGLDADAAADHVVHSTWVSLAVVGAAAGAFALVGGKIVSVLLGDQYADVGRLVAELAPWMVAFAAYSVVFPLVFVVRVHRWLFPVALSTFALDVVLGLGLRSLAGMTGIAIGLALATFAVVGGLMLGISPRMARSATIGLARQAVLVGGSAAVAFGVPALLFGPWAAALIGLALYVGFLALLRRHGLEAAVQYVRALH
jgi:hypothetical protein